MHPTSQDAIDRFADALWLEDGLSPNTLAAYKRDLTLLARWLQQVQGLALLQTQEHHLQAYFAERHAHSKATSANRRLTVLRRFFHWALREGLVQTDPAGLTTLSAAGRERHELLAQRAADYMADEFRGMDPADLAAFRRVLSVVARMIWSMRSLIQRTRPALRAVR